MVSCSVFKCSNVSLRNNNVSYHNFPRVIGDRGIKFKLLSLRRRREWLLRINRKGLNENNLKHRKVCSEHFIHGKPSHLLDEKNPDWAPSLKLGHTKFRIDVQQTNDKHSRNTHSEVTEESSKNSELTEMRGEASELRSEIKEFNKIDTSRRVNALADNDDELMNVKLELYEAFTDISNLKKENEMLTEKLSATEATKHTLQKSVSEKEEELATTKLKLEQAYKEVNALRKEKEELLEKLKAEDLVQSILQHPNKLHFYTGLNSVKDFNYILSLISDVEGRFRTLSSEKQLLIVLMKLKLDLRMADLGYRFRISGATACRICDIIIPVLEAKIDLLVKCPITAALKKNIPVSYKNTVYENLYQRLVKYSKSKTKQPEEEEGSTDFEKMDEECI